VSEASTSAVRRRPEAGLGDEALLREVAQEMLADLEQLADQINARVLQQHPALGADGDAAGLNALRRSTTANVGALSTLAFGVPPGSVGPPDGALDLVDRLACRLNGLPLLLRAYRLGAAETWQLLVVRLGARAPDVATMTRTVAISTAHLHAYVDHVSECFVARWWQINRDLAHDGRRRETALRALLCGEEVDPAVLDHPLERHHFAVAVRAVDAGLRSTARRVLGEIRERFAGAATIDLEDADGVILQWCSSTSRPTPRRLEHVLTAVKPNLHLVVSDVGHGRAGFLLAAQQARETLGALRRLRPDGGAATYRQLALSSTLLADPARAHRFAVAVLGPLAGDNTEAQRLRDTLRIYFTCQESKAATSQRLGIHEKTVAYRLRKAAELLGAPVEAQRMELEAALLVFDATA